jgi:lysophospholipid hydrolase
MGAFVGGLFAMKESLIQVLPPLHRFIQGMSSTWTQLRDLTFPFTSYFSGYTFNLVMTEVFDETHIEDTWLPFFCVTTNLSKSDMGVHQVGSDLCSAAFFTAD